MNIEKSREALALLEVYLGLLQQRVEQIKREKTLPPELQTAVASIVYAATRVGNVPELRQLRRTLERKYGAKFLAAAAGEVEGADPLNAGVSEKLMACVNPGPPAPAEWVQKGLAIAAEQELDVSEEQLYQVRSCRGPSVACFLSHPFVVRRLYGVRSFASDACRPRAAFCRCSPAAL